MTSASERAGTSIALGIDLGTTRTSVAILPPDIPEAGWTSFPHVIGLADGVTTPSVVLFDGTRKVVGTAAKNLGHLAADCAQIFKRSMNDPDFEFSPGSDPTTTLSAQQLSEIVIASVVAQAAAAAGREFREVVVTVPAYFGEPERRRTRDAAIAAGVEVLDIINEPTAAILAYLAQPGVSIDGESVLVFDLGGGTFDTVVVDLDGDRIEVVSIDGDGVLGGRDFDLTVAFELAERFAQVHPGVVGPMGEDEGRNALLLLDVERAREGLSAVQETNIVVWGGEGAERVPMNVRLTRDDLATMVGSLIDRCITIARRALQRAADRGVVPSSVLFVGGMTRSPMVHERVSDELGLVPLRTAGADPDLLVAKGAAVWAQKLVLQRDFDETAPAESDIVTPTDWTQTATRERVRALSAATGYPRASLDRLLRLTVGSTSSRGYSLLVRGANGESELDYIIAAGEPLPVRSPVRAYVVDPTDEWFLHVYEDEPHRERNKDPGGARLVEVVRRQMRNALTSGGTIAVQFTLRVDQILQVDAWRYDAKPGEEESISVSFEPRGQ